MFGLGNDAHVLAMDLPGIGSSQGVPQSNDQRTLAEYIAGVVERRGLFYDAISAGFTAAALAAFETLT
jgi:hypothetical protein